MDIRRMWRVGVVLNIGVSMVQQDFLPRLCMCGRIEIGDR